MTTLLIDGDIVIYKAALAAQTSTDMGDGQYMLTADLDAAKANFDEMISSFQRTLKAAKAIIALTDRENFRKEIMPSYKANRKSVQRPLLLQPLREYVVSSYNAFIRPTLEADDVLGILATNPKIIKERKIIVSTDKDLRTIPALHWNPDKQDAPQRVSEEEADRFFYSQILTGDPTDGYGGCPNVGKVKAAKLLCDVPVEDMWGIIVQQYEKAGLDVEAALQTARVARILRHVDYDYKERKPILWQPANQ